MHEKVREFLFSQKDAERQKHEKVKARTLNELGLYDKVYSPDNKCNKEYPYGEWDEQAGKDRYYKKVPVPVTEEEYQEILRYTKKEDSTNSNPVATALTAIAWIVFLLGFIAGIVLGQQEVVVGTYYQYTVREFSFAIAFTYWCAAFISGTMFLGFAEIIKLLHAIKNK